MRRLDRSWPSSFFWGILTLSVWGTLSVSWGAGVSTPAPAPSASPSPVPPFHANPTSIRIQVLEHNNDLTLEFEKVRDAKDNLYSAKLGLLPQLSLSAIADVTSPVQFLLSSVDFLLPFLLPSTYFNIDADKNTFDSEKLSYQILELNTYYDALNLYYTALADQAAQAVYDQEASDLGEIAAVQESYYAMGQGQATDAENAEAKYMAAEGQAALNRNLILNEITDLQEILAQPLGTEVILDPVDMPASGWETEPASDAVAQAYLIAPEREQIDDLVAAAKDQEWSGVFDFLSKASLGAQQSSSGSTDLSKLDSSGTISLGAQTYPTLILANRNITEIQNQYITLHQQLSDTLGKAIGGMAELLKEIEFYQGAVNQEEQAYENEDSSYALGNVSNFVDMLDDRVTLAGYQMDEIEAKLALNLARVQIHRTMISDQFSQIKGCIVDQPPSGGLAGWLGGLFGGSGNQLTLDEVCREGGSAAMVPRD